MYICIMGAINNYINKKLSSAELEEELKTLISQYNVLTGRYLFIYSSAMNKGDQDIALCQEDYFIIHDLLQGLQREGIRKIDVYLETPGGSGETAEEIVRFLRKEFTDEVNFLIAGEAKSAGTIMALSGNNIMMAETGSLGPIDAQIFIGRTIVSAYDYKEWVEEKQAEYAGVSSINPFDATIVAQISPGEIGGVINALNFAIDLVENWLCQYKFADWTETETNKIPVTLEMRQKRANEIATALANHSKWRSHGRSLKIEDLEELGLQIVKIDEDLDLAKIVYNIKAVLMLLFLYSPAYKVYGNASIILKKYTRSQSNVNKEEKE